jgi:hypothetical protein
LVRTHACIASCVAELIECHRPRLEVCDWVLDVKNGHGWNVRRATFFGYPRKLGFRRRLGA